MVRQSRKDRDSYLEELFNKYINTLSNSEYPFWLSDYYGHSPLDYIKSNCNNDKEGIEENTPRESEDLPF